jgi:hypothetical protein
MNQMMAKIAAYMNGGKAKPSQAELDDIKHFEEVAKASQSEAWGIIRKMVIAQIGDCIDIFRKSDNEKEIMKAAMAFRVLYGHIEDVDGAQPKAEALLKQISERNEINSERMRDSAFTRGGDLG